jgi:hypothetical protein
VKTFLKVLLGLALVAVIVRSLVELFGNYLAERVERSHKVFEVSSIAGADPERVEDFLTMVENAGIDYKIYTSADLARAYKNGFVLKLVSE